MSSFFTLPASQRKRKRTQPSAPSKNASSRAGTRDDESISGSDISDGGPAVTEEHGDSDEEDEFEDEDPGSKRIRLAQQYLANTQKELLEDGEFDAADVDQENLRRRIGERLKEDTAETKGKLYRWIADGLDWQGAARTLCRQNGMKKSATGIAVHGRHVYAVSKDTQLIKWELPESALRIKGRRVQTNAKIVARTQGSKKSVDAQQHLGPILCIAVSPDGKFVATGGADKKLIVWDATTLTPLKVFMQHRDSVTALAFREGTNQLFSASKDRTVKIWSLDELAYVETLFGHQDEVVGVDALAQEKCVTVGARDRTARFWKVVEESQLVFRGGGAPGTSKALDALRQAYKENEQEKRNAQGAAYNEGSMDHVAMIDDETFVTGSDNGSISLWNIHKKKAVFTVPLAHGLDPPLPLEQASAEQVVDESVDEKGRGGKQPRWITALRAIPLSDVVISGSWDGYVRVWKISLDKRRIETLGAVGEMMESVDSLLDKEGLSSASLTNGALEAMKAGVERHGPIDGVINDLAVVDRGERGKDGILIAAALGKEHRLGRWKEFLSGKNGVALFRVPLKKDNVELDEKSEHGDDEEMGDVDNFEGFD